MHTELAWLKAIAPDLMGVVTKRYQVLQFINWMAPVGRRTLAEQMKISERALRTETDFLRGQGLLESSKSGMVLTAKGLETFHGLDHLMNQLLGIKDDEKRLATHLEIDHCLVVSGDADQSSRVLDELGKTLNSTLQLLLPPGHLTIAVMGGTTMAHLASQLTFQLSAGRELSFVPHVVVSVRLSRFKPTRLRLQWQKQPIANTERYMFLKTSARNPTSH